MYMLLLIGVVDWRCCLVLVVGFWLLVVVVFLAVDQGSENTHQSTVPHLVSFLFANHW